VLAFLWPILAHAVDAVGPSIVFEESAAKLPQRAIRAAIEQELDEPAPGNQVPRAPSRTRVGARLAIAVSPEGSLVVRYEDDEGVLERTLAMPSRESDVPVVIGLIAGNLARDQRFSETDAPRVARKENAPAEESEIPGPSRAPSKRNYFWVHGEGGVGVGKMGLGARYGGEAVFWFSDLLGVGLAGGASSQSAIFGPSVDDWFVAPELALRANPEGHLAGGFVNLAAGFGHETIRGSCLFSACSAPSPAAAVGLYTGLGLGYVGQSGRLLFGPVLRVEAMFAGATDVLFTLNLAIGVAP
jgi:hypothetical protein